MPQDSFSTHAPSLIGPATRVVTITPSDSNDLSDTPRALSVGESGWVSVVTAGGDTATIYVAAGVPFPIRVRRVRATGTTATGLRGLF